MGNRTVDSGANQGLNGTAPPVARHAEAAPPDGAAMVTLIERSVVLLLVAGLLIGVAAVLRPFTTAQALADSVLQVVLSLVVATMLWMTGDRLAGELRDIFRRLGGAAAEETLDAVAGAVRGVALGVIGTAMIQAVLLAIGLAVAG